MTVCLTFLSTEAARPLRPKVINSQVEGCRVHWLRWSGGGCCLCTYGKLICGTPAVCILANPVVTKADARRAAGCSGNKQRSELLFVCLPAGQWSLKLLVELSCRVGVDTHTLRDDRYIKMVSLQLLNCFTTLQP